MKKILSLFVAITMVSSMVLLNFGSATVLDENINLNENIYDELANYITQNENGTLYLDLTFEESNLTETEYDIVINNINATNQMILENTINSDEHGNIQFTEEFIEDNPDLIVIDNSVIIPEMNRAGGGTTKLVQYWWGMKIYLSNTASKNYVAGVSIYSAVRRIAPTGTVEIILGIIAAVGAAQISRCNYGDGVIITYNQVLQTITGVGGIVYALASVSSQ